MDDVKEMTGHINALARGFMHSQVLFVANEAGVFAHLEQPATAADIAGKTGWDQRGTRMLLEGLVALGLARKTGSHYLNTPISSACLVPNRPAYQGHIVRHIQNTAAGWWRLKDAVATGKAVDDSQPSQTSAELQSFILGMKDIAKTSAEEILKVVDLAPYKHLLDVGAGPGTYTIAFLHAHTRMKATIFDRPDVIPIAREQVCFAELDHRVKFIAGDVTHDALGSGHDVVLVSNLIHSLSPERNQALMRKCFDAMEPGGLLIVKDFLTDNDRTGPAFSLIFALHMLVGTGEGDAYSFDQVESWTNEAGFEKGRIVDLTPQTRLWLVKKPFPKQRGSLIGFLDKTTPAKAIPGDPEPEE